MDLRQVKHWWRKKVKELETPAFAMALTELKPQSIASDCGRHISAVFTRGTRHYCFETQANRDRFLTYYRRVYGARACGDPIGQD